MADSEFRSTVPLVHLPISKVDRLIWLPSTNFDFV